MASDLDRLRHEEFVVLHDLEQAGEGTIGRLVSGPTGVYLIETKANGYDESQLVRVKRQAAKVHVKFRVWVTPVICLRSRIGRPSVDDGVWIVPERALLDWIRSQRNRAIPFETLARLADGL